MATERRAHMLHGARQGGQPPSDDLDVRVVHRRAHRCPSGSKPPTRLPFGPMHIAHAWLQTCHAAPDAQGAGLA